ncbi:MAG: hypothetical protein KDK33_06280, partial [Leptospiraceae bacterium]|nr:hypothetical protein [Leptospiraceae bacterium]
MKSIYVRIILLPVFVFLIMGAIFYYSLVKPGTWRPAEFLEIYLLTGLGVLGLSSLLAYQATKQIVEPLRSLLFK